MDEWEKFNERSLPEKEEFYSNLIYHLDPVNFFQKVTSKKPEVKSELLTDIDMLLMVEKDIRGGICHAIHQYSNTNNKYMKDYDKNNESLCNVAKASSK